MPKTYRGVEQYPVNGVSMRYTFDNAKAPTQKKRQYYAMLGTRGIWQKGWKAAALHAPISGVGHFDKDRWEDGTILGVAIDVSEEIYLDLEREAVAALARD